MTSFYQTQTTTSPGRNLSVQGPVGGARFSATTGANVAIDLTAFERQNIAITVEGDASDVYFLFAKESTAAMNTGTSITTMTEFVPTLVFGKSDYRALVPGNRPWLLVRAVSATVQVHVTRA